VSQCPVLQAALSELQPRDVQDSMVHRCRYIVILTVLQEGANWNQELQAATARAAMVRRRGFKGAPSPELQWCDAGAANGECCLCQRRLRVASPSWDAAAVMQAHRRRRHLGAAMSPSRAAGGTASLPSRAAGGVASRRCCRRGGGAASRSRGFAGEVPRRTSFVRREEGVAGRRPWRVESCFVFLLFFLV
jgi:hypothetical protein